MRAEELEQNDPAAADGAAGGSVQVDPMERMAIVVATVVGAFGVIAALGMFSNLDVIPEGVLVAVLCLLGSCLLSARLRTSFRDREEHRPLTPTEDALTAVALALPHAAVVAIILQVYASSLSLDSKWPLAGATCAVNAANTGCNQEFPTESNQTGSTAACFYEGYLGRGPRWAATRQLTLSGRCDKKMYPDDHVDVYVAGSREQMTSNLPYM